MRSDNDQALLGLQSLSPSKSFLENSITLFTKSVPKTQQTKKITQDFADFCHAFF